CCKEQLSAGNSVLTGQILRPLLNKTRKNALLFESGRNFLPVSTELPFVATELPFVAHEDIAPSVFLPPLTSIRLPALTPILLHTLKVGFILRLEMTEPGYSLYDAAVAAFLVLQGRLARWFAAVVIWCISLDAGRSLLDQVDKSIYCTRSLYYSSAPSMRRSSVSRTTRNGYQAPSTVAESVAACIPTDQIYAPVSSPCSDRQSPRPVTGKEENDVNIIPTPKHAARAATAQRGDISAQNPSSSSFPISILTKKRQTTITGINTSMSVHRLVTAGSLPLSLVPSVMVLPG
ncbi:hypothetical protein BC835DRAFT_1491284, partial [Cytidiella melzeri]